MNKIVLKKELGENVVLFQIDAPKIAKKRKAGQFVILRINDQGERIPLTIADSDPEKGTITLIIQGLGKTTKQLNSMKEGESIRDIAGPLGTPTHIEKFGTCAVVGGGIGTAVALPVAKALKTEGNEVISILGARTKSLMILENEMREASNELLLCTDDGSYGTKGFVTQVLKELIDSRKIDFVLGIGPLPMMRAVAETTRPKGIKTLVSLNPIMIDGTGMCGGCRVTVGGKTKFVCVDGPEFDGHKVDFAELTKRLGAYKRYEKKALDDHLCKIGLNS